MRFQYEYRTSDNVRHEGVVSAPDREAAFLALREKGIRPARLALAPGLANRILSFGKRGWLIVVLVLVLVAVLVALVGADRRAARAQHEAQSTRHEAQIFESTTRRQVIGDAAVIEKGILDGWSDVFANEGDRFLASFAIPGVKPRVRTTSVEILESCLKEDRRGARDANREAQDMSLESRQIVAMVEGMKSELRAYLRDGGTIVGYGRCLVERQERELALYGRAKAEIDALAKDKDAKRKGALRARWEAVNDNLRAMGIKLVPWPEEE